MLLVMMLLEPPSTSPQVHISPSDAFRPLGRHAPVPPQVHMPCLEAQRLADEADSSSLTALVLLLPSPPSVVPSVHTCHQVSHVPPPLRHLQQWMTEQQLDTPCSAPPSLEAAFRVLLDSVWCLLAKLPIPFEALKSFVHLSLHVPLHSS